MSGTRNLLAIPLVLLAGGAMGGLDYMQFQRMAAEAGEPATFSVWTASVSDRVRTGITDMGDMMATDLTGPLPRARGDWTVAPYADADGEALTGLVTPDAPVDGLSMDAMLYTLAAASHDPGTEAVTYKGPDGQSVVMLVSLAAPGQTVPGLYTPTDAEMAMLLPAGGGAFAESGLSIHPFNAGGLALPLRQFLAQPGTDISLHILTDANDADLTALLEDMDHPGFIALQEPEGLDRTTAAFAALSLPVPGSPESRPRQPRLDELMGGGPTDDADSDADANADALDVAAAAPATAEPATTGLAAGECTTTGAIRRCAAPASN